MAWTNYCQLWLRSDCYSTTAGQRALIAGSGIGSPRNVAECDGTRYFPTIERCALVADRGVLANHLRAKSWLQGRPEKRKEFLDSNDWFRKYGPEHDIELIDTIDAEVQQTVKTVEAWVSEITDPT